MIWITYSDTTTMSWELSMKGVDLLPCFDPLDVQYVVSVQATGKELERIKYLFGSTIPSTSESFQCWYGDIARTILINL